MDTVFVILLVACLAFLAGRLLPGLLLPGRSTDAGPPQMPEVERLGAELRRLTELVHAAERERAQSFGMLGAQIRAAGEQTARLAETTGELRTALAGSRSRGQWGERMAEDVLRTAGLVEHVNYVRQTAADNGSGVPDFTFLLPRGMRLHMDVKFPLDNYLRHVRAEHEAERQAAREQFLHDVRTCVRGLARRGYADSPEAVDCVLLFIPNEQVFAFVQQHEPDLFDEALRAGVVCCSPLTLFAVLAVVRQAVDTFRLERTTDEVLIVLGRFSSQWHRFTEELDRLGRQLETVRRTYDELTGPRRRQLERPLEQLDTLRAQRGLDDAEAQSEADEEPSMSDDSPRPSPEPSPLAW